MMLVTDTVTSKLNYHFGFVDNQIGKLELKNRIVMSPMHIGFCKGGYVSERAIRFYQERAKGGAGLILVGGCTINPFPGYWSSEAKGGVNVSGAKHGINDEMKIGDNKFIPGHQQLARSCQQLGVKIGAQIFHTGRNDTAESLPIAPSPIPSPLTRTVPREMTYEDIQDTIGLYADAAVRVKKAGYDLVEISCGYLIGQFFSPVTNVRTDRYGGSLENRMRFGKEVVEAVRKAVGSDFPISARISGKDFMNGGSTAEDSRQFAVHLQDEGASIINVSAGWHESKVPQITMAVPPGAYTYLAKGVKQAVHVPVIASHRINDPMLAEKILLEGNSDLVGMARALIADPEFPNKTKEGRINEIRKCVGCNPAFDSHSYTKTGKQQHISHIRTE